MKDGWLVAMELVSELLVDNVVRSIFLPHQQLAGPRFRHTAASSSDMYAPAENRLEMATSSNTLELYMVQTHTLYRL